MTTFKHDDGPQDELTYGDLDVGDVFSLAGEPGGDALKLKIDGGWVWLADGDHSWDDTLTDPKLYGSPVTRWDVEITYRKAR